MRENDYDTAFFLKKRKTLLLCASFFALVLLEMKANTWIIFHFFSIWNNYYSHSIINSFSNWSFFFISFQKLILKSHTHEIHEAQKKVEIHWQSLFFFLIGTYNFTDQETAQSRNLSQSPNPDLVLGPRLRGQSPGRSPSPKRSHHQSESFSKKKKKNLPKFSEKKRMNERRKQSIQFFENYATKEKRKKNAFFFLLGRDQAGNVPGETDRDHDPWASTVRAVAVHIRQWMETNHRIQKWRTIKHARAHTRKEKVCESRYNSDLSPIFLISIFFYIIDITSKKPIFVNFFFFVLIKVFFCFLKFYTLINNCRFIIMSPLNWFLISILYYILLKKKEKFTLHQI